MIYLIDMKEQILRNLYECVAIGIRNGEIELAQQIARNCVLIEQWPETV